MNVELQKAGDEPILYSPDRRQRNGALQGLRAIAALTILLYHASVRLAYETGDERFSAIFGHQFGITSVAIFFAISGALMADILKYTDAHHFLMHRIIRIYPIFILVSLILPNLIAGTFGVDIRALVLVPTGGNANYRLHMVEWTLVFEMFFYVVLYLISVLGLQRHLERIAAVWLLWTLAIAFLGWAEPRMVKPIPFITSMLFQTTNAAFAAGLLIPALVRRGFFSPAMAPVAAGLVLMMSVYGLVYDRLIASFASMIFVGLVFQMRVVRSRDSILSQTAAKFGDWSYALYLCNASIVIWLMASVELPPAYLWTLAVLASIAISVPLGMLDLAIYRSLRKKLDGAKDRQVKLWAAAFTIAYGIAAFGFQLKG
jgi:peptidoglycan/LPS O-acetylase OafA/YrhL